MATTDRFIYTSAASLLSASSHSHNRRYLPVQSKLAIQPGHTAIKYLDTG